MALIVEDGSVVANAESYESVTGADSFWTDHGSPSDWTGATTPTKESALRWATAWIDAEWTWRGVIVSNSQVLAWPRSGVVDDEGRSIASDSVPLKLKQSVSLAALAHITGDGLDATQDTGLRSVKVGPIEVEFFSADGSTQRYPMLEKLLRGLYFFSSGFVYLIRA